MRVLFIALILCVCASYADAKDIEIIVAGKSYYTMDAYKDAQRSGKSQPQVKPEKIDPQTQNALDKLQYVSSEDNVSRVKADFHQNWDNPSPKFTIDSEELQQRLEAVADDRKEPVMVVSENGKLRVMLLDEDHKAKEIQ